MKLFIEREQKDLEAFETLIKEMEVFGWIKSPDTKEIFTPYSCYFEKDDHRIIITWSEFVTFQTDITVNGYVLIAIAKYLQSVKL